MKKLRQEVLSSSATSSGVWRMADEAVMVAYNITYDELNILDHACDEKEIEILFDDSNVTFTDRRQKLELRNKYVPHYQQKYGKNICNE